MLVDVAASPLVDRPYMAEAQKPGQRLLLVSLAVVAQLVFLAGGLAVFGGDASYLIEAHDAKFYLDQVADPFLIRPETVTGWGEISYWGLRIGFPLLGWPLRFIFGSFGALFAVHLVAVAFGSLWASQLAASNGKSPWWGLVMAINPATLWAAVLLLPDALAYAAVIGVLVMAARRRWLVATLLAVLAVATKEASLAPIGLMALHYWRRGERQAVYAVAAPLAWHVSWGAVLTARFGFPKSAEFLSWPFVGFVEAGRRVWFVAGGIHPAAIVAATMLVLAVIAVIAWFRRPTPVLAAAAGAALIYPFMDWEVLYPLSNVPRIGGWLFPLLAVGLGGYGVRTPIDSRKSVL